VAFFYYYYYYYYQVRGLLCSLPSAWPSAFFDKCVAFFVRPESAIREVSRHLVAKT
jgi:hypothetical protein